MNKKNNPKKDESPRQDYYHEAQNWHEEMKDAKEQQIAIYRNLCMGLFGVFTMAMIGLVTLITRESVQPFLAIMDKRTGEVTTPTRLNTQSAAVNWNMIRHFVTTYVTDRESYNFLNLNEPYQTVMAMSDAPVKSQVDHFIRPELNPESPIKKQGQHHYTSVTIHSISKLSSDHLLDIRFTSHLINTETNRVEQNHEWRATMKWKLINQKQSLSAWDKNPLGFTVTFYDRQPVVS